MTCLLVVRNATLNCYLEKTFFVNNVFHISTRKLVFPNKRPKTSSLTRVYIFIRSITSPRCSAIRFSVLKTRFDSRFIFATCLCSRTPIRSFFYFLLLFYSQLSCFLFFCESIHRSRFNRAGYIFTTISTSFSFPYVTNIYQIYCVLAALFSHIASIQNTLQYLRFRILHFFTALVRTKSSPSWTLFYFSIVCSERVGGITLPFFSFLPCLISIGRTFRFGAHFKYVHSKPFLLVFFVLVLFFLFFFLFVYLVYIGDGAKAL